MNFIIDANNLAGKLQIIHHEDFDKRLIALVSEWLGDKQKKVVLVFDSLDSLGDQYSLGNLEVIYAPRNNFSKTADDKIIEIFTQWKLASSNKTETTAYCLNIIKKLVKDDLTFVSDDQDLITKVAAIKSGIGENIRIIGNDQFIAQLEKKTIETAGPEVDRGLSGDEVEKINDELLSIWKEVK